MTTKGTINGREAFMQNIANRFGRKQPQTTAPARPFVGVPEHYAAVSLNEDEKINLFIQNWSALNGKVLIVDRHEAAEAIQAYIGEVCAELGVTRVARWEHEALEALGLDEPLKQRGVDVLPWKPLDEMPDWAVRAREEALAQQPGSGGSDAASNWGKRSPLLRAAETCQMGVVWPDYAIANTSTLALLARGGRGRSVSLVTTVLMAIFRADQLVTRMGEAFEQIRSQYAGDEPLPSSLNLITGPSRSADIENDLTIGIHGPGKVYAVIIK